MVVLDSNGMANKGGPTSSRGMSNLPYHHLQYVQPLSNDYDEKCDPLAMLTRACNKIETDLMKSHNADHKISSTSSRQAKLSSESPRSSTTSDRPDSSSPGHSNKPATSTSPIDYKLRPPSGGGERSSRTPKRPASSSSNSSTPPASKLFSPKASSSEASSQPPVSSASAYSLAASPHFPHGLGSPLGLPPGPGVCVDPMCRDPACPTTAARNAHFLNFFAGARGIPPYFYPPVTTAAMMGLTSPQALPQPAPTSTTTPTSTSSSSSSATSTIGGSSPFVCNWMNGGEFCGRRFSTSDDLMSHLRSHTTTAAASAGTPSSTSAAVASPSPPIPSPVATQSLPSPADTLAALQAAQLQALYPALGSQSALAALQARAASAAASSLSPNSAASRYHPYMRPGGLGLPPPPQGLPPGFQFGHFPHLQFGAGSPFLHSPYGLPPFPYP